MRKVFGLLLSFLLVFTISVASLTVNADEAEDVVLIYFENPDGWDTPNVWTWDADGTGAFANLGWPGKAMTEDTTNTGWYYLYVPATMTNVIVNSSDGADGYIQTEAFEIAGENVWVTVTEAEGVYTGTTSTVQATSGVLPEYVATKYVYAYVPIDWDAAALWAWNDASGEGVFSAWPGQEMTLLDDGWFMYEIPDTADKIIINNNNADACLQTVDLVVGTEDVYVLLDDEANTDGKFEATLSDEKPVIIEDGITLYITVPEGWTTPCLWAWSHPDGTNLYTTWPGNEITYNEDSGYYEVEVPTWINRVIVNNGSTGDDAAQTVDAEVDTTGDRYLYVGDVDAESGNYNLSVFDSSQTDTTPVDTSDDTTEPTSSSAGLYIGIAAVVVIAAGAIIFVRKRA